MESINIKTTVVVSWCENKGKWVVTELASGEQFDLYDYEPLDSITGNIYENPELIKQ